MITGSLPWRENGREEIIKEIINCEIYYPFIVSLKMKEELKSILKKNPDERFSIDQIRKFIQVNFLDVLSDLSSQNQKSVVSNSYLYSKNKSFLVKKP
jgi:hypothetical protein